MAFLFSLVPTAVLVKLYTRTRPTYNNMTVKDDPKKEEEPDIVISDAVPAGGPPQQTGGPPVPAGHNRFYCEKCRTVRTFIANVEID